MLILDVRNVRGRGSSEVLPLQKGGTEKALAIAVMDKRGAGGHMNHLNLKYKKGFK